MYLIDIFKAGKRPDANGNVIDITTAQLAETVKHYNPQFHEAPLVIGHPKANHPAWGWVKGLQLNGDTLQAQVDELDPEFAEMVKAGRFKKVSAAFYLPDSPANPHQGILSLRHVGFLGAMPPAVKGLSQVAFNEGEDGIAIVELDDPIFNETAQPEGEPQMSAEEKAELERLKAENAELKAAQAKAAQEKADAALAAEKASNAEFAEGLVKAGKLAPVVKASLVQALDNLSELKAGREPEFSEGEDILSQFKSALAQSPVLIEFNEVATKENVAETPDNSVEYAEGTDPASIEVDKKVRAYMQTHNVTYNQAFNALYL